MTESKFQTMARFIQNGIERGNAPWLVKHPESAVLPFNPITGEVYKSINSVHLSMQEFNDPRWCSYDQATSAGWNVKGGSNGTLLQVWKYSEKIVRDGKTEKVKLERPKLRFVYVFNGEQINGIPSLEREAKPEGVKRKSVTVSGEDPPLGSDEKLREDLVSAIVTYFYNIEHGLGHEPPDYSAYLDRWSKMIAEDPLVIFKACGEAEKLKNEFSREPGVKQERSDRTESQNNEGVLISFYETAENGDIKVVKRKSRKPFPHAGVAVFKNPLFTNAEPQNREGIEENGYDGVVIMEGDKPTTIIFPSDQRKYPSMKAAGRMNPDLERVYLNVPYESKDDAKSKGADWSGENWYFLKGVNTSNDLSLWKTQKVTIRPEEAFAAVIQEMGGDLGGELPIMDGKGHRIPVVDGRRGNQDMSYIGYLDGVPNGHVKNFKTNQTKKWKHAGTDLSPTEKEELRLQAAEKKKRREQERAHEYDKIAKESVKYFQSLQSATGKEKYFEDYHLSIKDPNVKSTSSGAIVVPFKDVHGRQWGHKRLQPNGFKQIFKGSKLEGNFHIIGADKISDIKGDITLVEGYSTGAALHGVMDEPVVVCFTSGNMEAVAKAIKEFQPDKDIVVAADDDLHLEAKGKVNAGVEQGRKAAGAVGGLFIKPSFYSKEPSPDTTDFRDMVRELGKEKTKDYFLAQKKIKKATREKENKGRDLQQVQENHKQPVLER